MSPDQQLQINERLLERERLFLRIHDLEQQINSILGESYPFDTPELPSSTTKKKKKSARLKESAEKTFVLRKLAMGETAYRITYTQHGGQSVEIHPAPEAIRTLLACVSSEIEVLKIETVDDLGRDLEVLYEGKDHCPTM